MKAIKVWTDGSANNKNKDKGGYGFVIVNRSVKQYCSKTSYHHTNSVRQEMRAVIQALKKCQTDHRIIINCDCQFIVNAIEKGWVFDWQKRNWSGKANSDLWQQFMQQWSRHRGNIKMNWLRGHQGDHYNEVADRLANMGANKEKRVSCRRIVKPKPLK